MKREKRIFLLVLFALAFLLGSCSSDKKQEAQSNLPKKITIGTIRVANDKTLAQEMGFFKEFFESKGIAVEMLFFDSGTAANVAFAADSIDFAGMGYTNGVVALSKNLNVEMIWIHEVLGANEALVAKEEIMSVKDLAGKKVATPFSSTSHLSLIKALEMNGLSQNDVILLDMDTDDIVAAWERGDIDAAYTWEPTLSKIKQKGKVLLDSEYMAQNGVTTVNIELANKNFTKKYPDLTADYISALAKAGELYAKESDKAIAANARALSITPEETRVQMEGTIWLSRENQLSEKYLGNSQKPGQFHQVFEDTAKFLKDTKKIDRVPAMEEINFFINSSYIEMSLRKNK